MAVPTRLAKRIFGTPPGSRYGHRAVLYAAALVLVGVCAYAGLDGSTVLPLDHDAIQYAKLPASDRVAHLQQDLEQGRVKLDYNPTFGYLPAVLKQLGVSRSSQVLVFSKTSFQAPRISPRMPRALYFTDDVSVGFVRGGDVLELAASDPRQGIIFYTLDQERSAKPRFERQDECLQCHASGATLGVPGLLVRSVYPDRNGMPIFTAGSFITDHRSPLKQRWGGWYVSGKEGDQKHLGNTTFTGADAPERTDTMNVTDLSGRIDPEAYLRPTSDIVALMVLEHQTRMTNLITRVGWETRMAVHDREVMNKALGEPAGTPSESTTRRINNAVEELVRYMLFTDETPLSSPVSGNSGFQAEYSAAGTRDSRGRSLRDLDLTRRLYKYPCSPLIYSSAFGSLPDEARNRALARLEDVLGGKDESPAFASVSREDRKAIREILAETKVLPATK